VRYWIDGIGHYQNNREKMLVAGNRSYKKRQNLDGLF